MPEYVTDKLIMPEYVTDKQPTAPLPPPRELRTIGELSGLLIEWLDKICAKPQNPKELAVELGYPSNFTESEEPFQAVRLYRDPNIYDKTSYGGGRGVSIAFGIQSSGVSEPIKDLEWVSCPTPPEPLKRICDESLEEWDRFHGLGISNAGVMAYTKVHFVAEDDRPDRMIINPIRTPGYMTEVEGSPIELYEEHPSGYNLILVALKLARLAGVRDVYFPIYRDWDGKPRHAIPVVGDDESSSIHPEELDSTRLTLGSVYFGYLERFKSGKNEFKFLEGRR